MLARILYCVVEKFDGRLILMNIQSVSDVHVKLNPININIIASTKFVICDCLSENRPSLHLPVYREIPF